MLDHSVSMRTYVKHMLAYGNVSEKARKGFLCSWHDWRTQFSASISEMPVKNKLFVDLFTWNLSISAVKYMAIMTLSLYSSLSRLVG